MQEVSQLSALAIEKCNCQYLLSIDEFGDIAAQGLERGGSDGSLQVVQRRELEVVILVLEVLSLRLFQGPVQVALLRLRASDTGVRSVCCLHEVVGLEGVRLGVVVLRGVVAARGAEASGLGRARLLVLRAAALDVRVVQPKKIYIALLYENKST